MPMRYTRLAALLSIKAPAEDEDLDEQLAIAAVEKLRSDHAAALAKLTVERDAASQRATNAETELGTLRAAASKREQTERSTRLDAVIERAYTEKKIVRLADAEGNEVASPFEKTLREMEGTHGLAHVETYVQSLPVLFAATPITHQVDPVPRELGAVPAPRRHGYAEQTGHDPDELAAAANL